jgi:cytosine deaminase
VKDTFYPFGRVDPLEVGLIAAHAAHMSMPQEIEQVFDMQTNAAAKVMRLADYGFEPGCTADLVILDAGNASEALCKQAVRSAVIKNGRVIVENETRQDWRWTPQE